MGDYPLAQLAGRTVLAAAATPIWTNWPGGGTGPGPHHPPGMEPGVILRTWLMSYDPGRLVPAGHLGGAALGVNWVPGGGLSLQPGDPALRSGRHLHGGYSAGHISSIEAQEIIQVLDSALGREGRRFYPGSATTTHWCGPRAGERPGAPSRPMIGAAARWATCCWRPGPPPHVGAGAGLLADPEGLRG